MSSSHLDPSGRLRMIDVGAKGVTRRTAIASCAVRMQQSTLDAIAGGSLPKGDVLAVAQVAAVMAAKRTPELIPGCHPLRISAVEVTFEPGDAVLGVRVEVRGDDRTGFEMEALTACAIAALTVYDMCKGVDSEMEIGSLRLVDKRGGKSDVSRLDGVRVAVVTISTSAAAGEREDTSGLAIREWVERRGASVVSATVIPDEREHIASTLRACDADLVVTTGGTGVAPTDVTPEATTDAADKLVPGLAEVMRQASLRATPMAMISRGVAAVVGSALVINLPGSPKAVGECLDAVEAALAHAVDLLRGGRPH